eukprot:4458738-Amphidinium_carterae.2
MVVALRDTHHVTCSRMPISTGIMLVCMVEKTHLEHLMHRKMLHSASRAGKTHRHIDILTQNLSTCCNDCNSLESLDICVCLPCVHVLYKSASFVDTPPSVRPLLSARVASFCPLTTVGLPH